MQHRDHNLFLIMAHLYSTLLGMLIIVYEINNRSTLRKADLKEPP